MIPASVYGPEARLASPISSLSSWPQFLHRRNQVKTNLNSRLPLKENSLELRVAKVLVGQWHLGRVFQTLSQEFLFKPEFKGPPTSLPMIAEVVTTLSDLGFRDVSG